MFGLGELVTLDRLPALAALSYLPAVVFAAVAPFPIWGAIVVAILYAALVTGVYYGKEALKDDLNALNDELSNMTAGRYSLQHPESDYRYEDTRRLGNNIDRAMKNVRDKIGDVKVAEEIQELLIPEDMPVLPEEIDFHFTYEPALMISGDACGFYRDEQGLDFFIADVSGHGTGSGMVMSMFKVAHEMARQGYDSLPKRARATNKALCAALADDYIRVFGIIGRLEFGDPPKISFLNCCFEPPVVEVNRDVKPDTGREMARYGIGFGEPWNTDYNNPPTEEHVEHFDVRPGNALIFYTDGSTEAQNADGEYFGYDRLVHVVDQNAPTEFGMKGCFHKIVSRIEDYGETSDDITLMGFSRRSD